MEATADEARPQGVLIDSATFARLAAESRGVTFTRTWSGEDGSGAAWTPVAPAGARGTVKYDVYVSTNLLEGFTWARQVEETQLTLPRDDQSPVMFWVVLVAE